MSKISNLKHLRSKGHEKFDGVYKCAVNELYLSRKELRRQGNSGKVYQTFIIKADDPVAEQRFEVLGGTSSTATRCVVNVQ